MFGGAVAMISLGIGLDGLVSLSDSQCVAHVKDSPSLQREATQEAERLDCKKDGRKCKLCGFADDSPDPLALELGLDESLWWGYPPAQGKTSGAFCGYCVKVGGM